VTNGNAVVDNCNVCDSDPANDCVQGCDGAWGSGLIDDECGICGGDSTSCADCAGTPNGSAVVDNCGTCDADSSNDCTQDCAGTWGGDLEIDECNICGGDSTSCADCAGTPNGSAYNDECGTCDTDGSNDCTQDCAGEWGGDLSNDECGVCGGDNSTCADCAGVPNGDSWVSDCGCVAADNDGNDCDDCFGVPNGSSVEGECGVCDGGNTCADETSCEVGEGEIVPFIPFSTTGNTIGLVKDFSNEESDYDSYGGDYVYELNIDEYSVLNISTCGAGELGFDPVLTFYTFDDDCNAEFVAGNDDFSGTDYDYGNGLGLTEEEFGCSASNHQYDAAMFGLGLEAGNYMLVVSGYSYQEGAYPLSIEYSDESRIASNAAQYDEFISGMEWKQDANDENFTIDIPRFISFNVNDGQRSDCWGGEVGSVEFLEPCGRSVSKGVLSKVQYKVICLRGVDHKEQDVYPAIPIQIIRRRWVCASRGVAVCAFIVSVIGVVPTNI